VIRRNGLLGWVVLLARWLTCLLFGHDESVAAGADVWRCHRCGTSWGKSAWP